MKMERETKTRYGNNLLQMNLYLNEAKIKQIN